MNSRKFIGSREEDSWRPRTQAGSHLSAHPLANWPRTLNTCGTSQRWASVSRSCSRCLQLPMAASTATAATMQRSSLTWSRHDPSVSFSFHIAPACRPFPAGFEQSSQPSQGCGRTHRPPAPRSYPRRSLAALAASFAVAPTQVKPVRTRRRSCLTSLFFQARPPRTRVLPTERLSRRPLRPHDCDYPEQLATPIIDVNSALPRMMLSRWRRLVQDRQATVETKVERHCGTTIELVTPRVRSAALSMSTLFDGRRIKLIDGLPTTYSGVL